jgi:hypothetical protein
MQLRWQTSRLTFDKARFTTVIFERLADAMMAAAKEAFKDNFHRIPVWTGESRGGMRATAKALGLENLLVGQFNPRAVGKKRKNSRGVQKGPLSAPSNFRGPIRTSQHRVEIFIKNEADGFTHADKRAQKNTGPWKFAAGFSRSYRKHLIREIQRRKNIPISSFSTRHRVLKRG